MNHEVEGNYICDSTVGGYLDGLSGVGDFSELIISLFIILTSRKGGGCVPFASVKAIFLGIFLDFPFDHDKDVMHISYQE